MAPSLRIIADLNIRHYRDLLKSEIDPLKRRTIGKLLAEEEVKLARLCEGTQPSERTRFQQCGSG